MRDIKFRAWDKYKKEMKYVENLEWNMFEEKIKNISIGNQQDGYLTAYTKNHNSEKCDITALELMQYTGLKDKNGKEIYDGDIVEFSYDVFTGNFDTKVGRGTIEFIGGAFYIKPFEIEGKKIKDTDNEEWFLLYTVNTDTLKVIGNVFENGDILNDSKNTEKN